MATYTLQYPPAHDDAHVKATTKFSINYWPYFATDPAKSLTGTYSDNSWVAVNGTNTFQRFHIDLGVAKIIRRIYYENCHHSGANTTYGVQNFTFQGSNTGAGSFDDLVYANDGGWTNLDTAQGTFDQHIGLDQADPKYIVATNATKYRYYAFKFADTYGGATMGVRRVVLQTEDGYPFTGNFFILLCEAYQKGKKYFKNKGLYLPDNRLVKPRLVGI